MIWWQEMANESILSLLIVPAESIQVVSCEVVSDGLELMQARVIDKVSRKWDNIDNMYKHMNGGQACGTQ